ncbi:MAG: response regulator [Nocardioides sp.]
MADRSPQIRACVVDDHEPVRDVVVDMLEGFGVHVCGEAGTFEDGVAMIRRYRPELAVIDNRLPDGSGIDLCRQASADVPGIHLILHTGMISPLEESLAESAGVNRIALKSIFTDGLLDAVRQAVDELTPGLRP